MSRFASRLSPRHFGSRLVMTGAAGPGLLSPRLLYDPATLPTTPTAALADAAPDAAIAARSRFPSIRRPKEAVANILGFYQDPLSWLVVGLTSVILCYFGG